MQHFVSANPLPRPHGMVGAFLNTLLLYGIVAVGYLDAYWLLDWLSFLYVPAQLEITAWNPAAAASVILLWFRGVRWAPLVFVAHVSFDVVALQHNIDIISLIAGAGEALVYGGAVWLLRSKLHVPFLLKNFRDVILFCGMMAVAAVMIAVPYVLYYYFVGMVYPAHTVRLIIQHWSSDCLGVLIIVPLFILRSETRAYPRWRDFKRPAWIAKIALMSVMVCIGLTAWTHDIHILYLFYVPIVWFAATNAIEDIPVALVVIQATTQICAWKFNISPKLIFNILPFFMLTLTVIGLVFGALTNEREGARDAIKSGAARLRALLDMNPDCMLIVDMDGHIVAANMPFSQLSAFAPHRLIGQNISAIMPGFTHMMHGETLLESQDGTHVPVDISTSTVSVDDKFSSIVTVRDISARKQMEVQQRQRRAMTEQATRAHLTGSMAAVLAHELNQPLSAIVNYSKACHKTLEQGAISIDKAREQLTKVSAQAMRAASIISKLRDFFQHSHLDITSCDLGEVINETLCLVDDDIKQAGVDVSVHVAGTLMAAIDRTQIEQVLINLLRNSIEALHAISGQRTIRITAQPLPRGDIEVIVHDNGPGIPPEIANKLFSPFVTTRAAGMGLGLVICRSIIEAHSGRLWTEAQPTAGAEMHFTIPTSHFSNPQLK